MVVGPNLVIEISSSLPRSQTTSQHSKLNTCFIFQNPRAAAPVNPTRLRRPSWWLVWHVQVLFISTNFFFFELGIEVSDSMFIVFQNVVSSHELSTSNVAEYVTKMKYMIVLHEIELNCLISSFHQTIYDSKVIQ